MKRILIIVLSLLSVTAFADNVSLQRAENVAMKFLQSARGTRASSISLELVYSGKNSQSRGPGETPPLYVFNNEAGKGFVVVAGEDAAIPVLGYSDESNFESVNMPDNVRYWLEGYESQIKLIRKNRMSASKRTSAAWKDVSRGIESRSVNLSTALWGQGDPFNGWCPMVNGKNTLTGCVATALAIIMRYHRWPDGGVGRAPAYSYKVDGVSYYERERALYDYDWSAMYSKINQNSSYNTKTAVAKLMYDAAAIVQAEFGLDGTAASTSRVPEKISRHMKYSSDCYLAFKEDYPWSEWERKLKEEIDARRPVLYRGQSKDGGHAFVLDGYGYTAHFHFNWGWSGYCNGYYTLSAMYPEENRQIEGDFNDVQAAILEIKKNRLVEGLELRDLSCSAYEVESDSKYSVSAYIRNIGNDMMNFTFIKAALFSKHGTFKQELIGASSLVDDFYPFDEKMVKIDVSDQFAEYEVGDKIRLYFESKNGNRVWINSSDGKDEIELNVKAIEDLRTDDMTSSVESYQKNKEFSISLNTIYNKGNMDFTGDFCLALTDKSGKMKETLKTLHYKNKLFPGSSFYPVMFNPVKCTITKEMQKGDKIKLFFKSMKSGSWIQVKGKYSSSHNELEVVEALEKLTCYGLRMDPYNYIDGVPFKLKVSYITNQGTVAMKHLEIMAAVTDENGKIKENLKTVIAPETINPNSSWLSVPDLSCNIKGTVQDGDRIRLFFKSELTNEWMLIGPEKEDYSFEIVLKKKYLLSDYISYDYNKVTKLVKLTIPDGAKVEMKADEKDLSGYCRVNGSSCEVKLSELPKGTDEVLFTITYKGYSYSVTNYLPTK